MRKEVFEKELNGGHSPPYLTEIASLSFAPSPQPSPTRGEGVFRRPGIIPLCPPLEKGDVLSKEIKKGGQLELTAFSIQTRNAVTGC